MVSAILELSGRIALTSSVNPVGKGALPALVIRVVNHVWMGMNTFAWMVAVGLGAMLDRRLLKGLLRGVRPVKPTARSVRMELGAQSAMMGTTRMRATTVFSVQPGAGHASIESNA